MRSLGAALFFLSYTTCDYYSLIMQAVATEEAFANGVIL